MKIPAVVGHCPGVEGRGSRQVGWMLRPSPLPEGHMLLYGQSCPSCCAALLTSLPVLNSREGGLFCSPEPAASFCWPKCPSLSAPMTQKRCQTFMIPGQGTQWHVCWAGVMGQGCRQHAADWEHLKAERQTQAPRLCPAPLCHPKGHVSPDFLHG